MAINKRRGGKPGGRRDIDDLARRSVEMLRSLHLSPSVIIERAIRVRRTIDGAEVEVTIVLTPEAVEVRLPAGYWNGPAELVRCNRPWKRLSWEEIEAGDGFESTICSLVEEGLAERAAEYFTCRYCGESIPPEHGDGDACYGCRSKYEGVDY